MSTPVSNANPQESATALARALEAHSHALVETGVGALKVLHESVKQNTKALARLKAEVHVLSNHPHPHILKILDSRPAEGWFTTTYYGQGTLADNINRFKGQPLTAIRTLRPIVEAVATLHKEKLIHRDIKPANIFYSDKGLVLGDFGLVFFADESKTRISETYENVGSRDWMPPWAHGKRVEELTPVFDVFSLAKILWVMISGKTFLPLWYFERPENNIATLFPKEPHMDLVNKLLEMCICENEGDVRCPDATHLLEQMDLILRIMQNGGDLLRKNLKRLCRVCGYGEYTLVVDEKKDSGMSSTMGLTPVANKRFRIFSCYNCGHIQLFEVGRSPEAWGFEDRYSP